MMMKRVWVACVFLFLLLPLQPGCGDAGVISSDPFSDLQSNLDGIYRARIPFDQGTLTVEVLDDDLVHCEYAQTAPDAIFTSAMVGKTDYPGPQRIKHTGNVIETDELRLEIDRYGCIKTTDKITNTYLSTVCPVELWNPWRGISIDPSAFEHVYGLGQYFLKVGNANGDWISHGRFRTDGDYGNHFRDFWGGANGQIQFPVMYAFGPQANLGLFLDNVYKQDWDFVGDSWWQVRMYGEQVRFYLMTGPDLLNIRKDYMELSGRPPVPPRKAFGLWVSEFGFDNWQEIDGKLSGLREAKFPIDGFVLDLQWFGSTRENSPDSPMGGLKWDEGRFPNPSERIRQYADDHIGLITIEESYVAWNQWSFNEMKRQEGLVHICNSDNLTEFWNWMGHVGQIDWSKKEAAAWWHDNLRKPNIIDRGVMGHWTDLGEPERYDPRSCYRGVEPWKYTHGDIHNIYNLLWHQSIYEGYVRNQTVQRPFLLSRAGACGLQRFGAGMWSGDIASRLDVLATHMNSAMHMSFAGIDYYSTDTGGFWRKAMWGDTNVTSWDMMGEGEMFSQWFANAAWFDVPLRPHTYNRGFDWFQEDRAYHEVSPAKLGDVRSNLANLRQRYELIPYYYSLAYKAYLEGEPVIAPLVIYHQDDQQVHEMGHQKLIGKDLLVGAVASHGERWRSVYLPAGTWINFHTNEWFHSAGQWTGSLSLVRDGLFRLPVFARAGAILPMMPVDENTKDAFGNTTTGQRSSRMIVRVYADANPTRFTLYEDDGATVAAYDQAGRPTYATRTTELSQELVNGRATVTIGAAQGSFPGDPSRSYDLQVVTELKRASSVSLNQGDNLSELADAAALAAADRGFCNAGNGLILIRTGAIDSYADTSVVVELDDSDAFVNTDTNPDDRDLVCDAGSSSCADGSGCFPDSWRCDDFNDCADGSDEADCGAPDDQTPSCEAGSSLCADGSGCIPDSWRCDDFNDCADGSDEASCS